MAIQSQRLVLTLARLGFDLGWIEFFWKQFCTECNESFKAAGLLLLVRLSSKGQQPSMGDLRGRIGTSFANHPRGEVIG